MRIYNMITYGEMLGSFIKFSPLLPKELYRDQSGELALKEITMYLPHQ